LYRLRASLHRYRSETPQLPQRSHSADAVGYPIYSLKTPADLDRLYEKVNRSSSTQPPAPGLGLNVRRDSLLQSRRHDDSN
jgi:hypothetical protein